ncbi:hypothetical protein [Paraclostridium sordellii]|uniref:hypothetical protein n=1 Tax=Paraclostridium sordellii TaxID=1505 RepID=UPI0005E65618|nr:hypothetical protein [Paeniclostridium sordellii]CEO25110.1 Uncharacterised protein [[Clostridium] sordellii] [Paeniclostridium sordellii]
MKCKICGEDRLNSFGYSKCDSCSRKERVLKEGKEVFDHISILMNDCNITFEQAFEILKLCKLDDISFNLEEIKKSVYANCE